ncbi:unnamed protein product, partial [Allacma fusca]
LGSVRARNEGRTIGLAHVTDLVGTRVVAEAETLAREGFPVGEADSGLDGWDG